MTIPAPNDEAPRPPVDGAESPLRTRIGIDEYINPAHEVDGDERPLTAKETEHQTRFLNRYEEARDLDPFGEESQ